MKDTHFEFRLTAELKQKLQAAAKTAGKTASVFLIEAIEEKFAREKERPVFFL